MDMGDHELAYVAVVSMPLLPFGWMTVGKE
jgi:hypothetical protein